MPTMAIVNEGLGDAGGETDISAPFSVSVE